MAGVNSTPCRVPDGVKHPAWAQLSGQARILIQQTREENQRYKVYTQLLETYGNPEWLQSLPHAENIGHQPPSSMHALMKDNSLHQRTHFVFDFAS